MMEGAILRLPLPTVPPSYRDAPSSIVMVPQNRVVYSFTLKHSGCDLPHIERIYTLKNQEPLSQRLRITSTEGP